MSSKKRKGGKGKDHSSSATTARHDPGGDPSSSSTLDPGDAPTTSWTCDHALVGQVVMRGRALVPITVRRGGMDVLYGGVVDRAAQISSFHPESVRDRHPAVWRALVSSTPDSNNNDGSADDDAPSSGAQGQQRQNKQQIYRALDVISSDLTDRAFSMVPTATAIRTVEERLFRVVYGHVVQRYLPILILTAACEEVQSQFLKSYQHPPPAAAAATVEKAPGGRRGRGRGESKEGAGAATPASSWSEIPKEYYSKSPSSYLTPPPAPTAKGAAGAAANDMVAISFPSFTASQLSSRIKQGCQLVWRHYCDHHYQPPAPPAPATTTSAASAAAAAAAAMAMAEQRRSSSRISSKQVAAEPAHPRGTTTTAGDGPSASSNAGDDAEPTVYWKVVPGGKVALLLHERLVRGQTTGGREVVPPKASSPVGEAEESVASPPGEAPPDPATASSTEAEPSPTPTEPAGVAPTLEATEPAGVAPKIEDIGAPGTPVPTKATSGEGGAENGANHAGPDEDGEDDPVMESEPASAASSPDKAGREDDDDDDFVPAADEEDDDDDEEGEDDRDGGHAKSFVKENVKELLSEAQVLVEGGEGREIESSSAGGKVAEDEPGDGEEVDEEDVDLLLENPYLSATPLAVLEWLGRKTAKLLTVSDLQDVISSLLVKSNKKKSRRPDGIAIGDLLTELDERVWSKIDANVLLSPTSRVALRLTTEHEDESVEKWETSYFAKTQLTVHLLNQGRAPQRDFDEMNALLALYREQKTWDTWRYKCIHGGYTIWPSWIEAVRMRTKSAVGDENGGNTTDEKMDASNEQKGDSATVDDFAMAQSLAQQDTTVEGTGRRTTRRGGDASGVFYGNQSNMTQKQLMDALCRLISERSFQTAASLTAAVPDESSDPLRRIRAALGKLVWKRNQVAQIAVQADWTDSALRSRLAETPLQIQVEKETSVADPSTAEVTDLIRYIRYLQETELSLREIVLKNLTKVAIPLVATAADERPGSLEAMDASYFEDVSAVTWNSSGHSLLGKVVYRPAELTHSDERSVCRWFRVTSFCDARASVDESEDVNPQERPSIGLAKEPTSVERRKRFLAVQIRSLGDPAQPSGQEPTIALTEAQVQAGLKAADLEKERTNTSTSFRPSNPFTDGSNPHITLFPSDSAEVDQQVHGVVTGHDTIRGDDGRPTPRVLILPKNGKAIWVRLTLKGDSALLGSIEGDSRLYSIQQSDYHSSSPAFKECQGIVQYLMRHPKAGPFFYPVDPIALGIPQYPDIVKHPMDISTLSKNLESGVYSNIGPGQSAGSTAVARMLNGPFRRDVERIFDNAILFNPPDDWIHIAAVQLKKAVVKRMEQATVSAENKSHGRSTTYKSMYVDEDSDADMYEYESDPDESYTGSTRRKRKRPTSSQGTLKEDFSSRVIEKPLRLPKILSESSGLRGPFGDLPISRDSKSFTLPPEWTCRHAEKTFEGKEDDVDDEPDLDRDFDELLSLQKQVEENELGGLRRSTRAHEIPSTNDNEPTGASSAVEFVPVNAPSSPSRHGARFPRSRHEIELDREQLHEEHFAKLYKDHQKVLLSSVAEEYGPNVGMFADGAFPPYLGRVVPSTGEFGLVWEIREPYVVPALRWVLRGLVRSEHLSESEPLTSDSLLSGSILLNNVYTISDGEPFEEVDVKVLSRRKRADQGAEPSDDDVEMSEYEKLRAARVARNEEKLRELGLA